MTGQPDPQLAYEVPVQPGSLPRIIRDPEQKKPMRPEVVANIEWFKKQFARSRFDQAGYDSPVHVVAPESPEILTTIDFVRDYPQPKLVESLLKQINASQSSLTVYRQMDFGWPVGRPFDHVTSRYTGLPALLSAGVEPFDLNDDAASRQARTWLEHNAPVLTGLDQLEPDDLQLVQVQGLTVADQPDDIVHVHFQQRFGGYPVYGAQVALHMAASDSAGAQRPAYVTSSYFPIPDIQFAAPIERQQAIAAAEQALAAYRYGPDALQPLGERLASPAGAELADSLARFAVARDAALRARDAMAAHFVETDSTLSDRDLRSLFNRTWNRQEGQASTQLAWWNRLGSPADLPDTAKIGDLLAPPQLTNRDLLAIVPPSLQSWIEQPASATPQAVFLQLQDYDWERVQATKALARVEEWLTAHGASADISSSLAAVTGAWSELSEPGSPTWDAHIARIEGGNEENELLILPYAGRYYLAYLVELLTPSRDEGWRVFVNAESGAEHDKSRIIGRPEPLSMHFPMQYYASSQAVLLGNLTAMPPADITAANAGLSSLAQLKFHADVGGNAGGAAFTLAGLQNAPGVAFNHHKEGMNIAYHAWKFYNYFLSDCHVDPVDLFKWFTATGKQGPPLVIQAGKQGDTLTTGFVPSIVDYSGTITFQTAPTGGLAAEGGRKVHSPSLDPEVIYHEMAHGLMWLLNRVPFDNRHDSVPFGRALLEGYANYLARSLAAQIDPGSGQWARASYQDAIWRQRWSVAVPAVEPPGAHAPQSQTGLRHLAVPNYYPEVETHGLAVYDVGMIWTRALWDMRTFLSQQADVGADEKARIALADRLVMQSYRCVLGWSASFETAAEGLSAAARILLSQIAGLTSARQKEIVKSIQDRFFARGILAERGIQAIGQVTSAGNARWLAGADSGLRVSANPHLPWNQWQPITDAGNALPGVTDLFVHGDKSYIATELGVYLWDAATNVFSAGRVGGNEMTAQAPRCLAVVAGQLVAGTNYTLWRFDENQHNWKQWAAAGMELKLAASNIMTATVGGRNFCLVAALNDVQWARVDDARVATPGWTSLVFYDAGDHEVNPGWITSSCVVGATLYAATAYKGVWPVQLSRSGDDLKATAGAALPVAPPSSDKDPGMGKVLRLMHDGNQKLYAGTTTGLFEFDLQPPPPPPAPQPAAPQWTRVAGSPQTVATVVFPIAGAVAAGTAAGGLWIQQPTAAGGTEVAVVDTDVA